MKEKSNVDNNIPFSPMEQIADHATNIAEDIIFMVDALVIKHHADVKEEKHTGG